MMEFINKKKISSFSIENLNFIQIFKKKKENFQFLPNENTNFEYLTPKIQNDDYDKEIEIKIDPNFSSSKFYLYPLGENF